MSSTDLEKIRKAKAEWEKKLGPSRPARFTTLSDMDVPLLSSRGARIPGQQ